MNRNNLNLSKIAQNLEICKSDYIEVSQVIVDKAISVVYIKFLCLRRL